jgi:hypothetical protein
VRRIPLVATLAAAGFLAAVVALALFVRGLPHAIATGDAAVTEIFVLHATRGPWALGPYSQFYWNHPGPLMFYLLAPLYAVSGQHAQALNVGAAALNLLALAALLRSVARGAEPVATAAASAAVAVWVLRASDALSSFWNPILIACPALLFVWLCAIVASGRAGLIVPLVGVGSFLAQSHIGLVPAVGVLSTAALAVGGGRARRADVATGRRRWRRGLVAGGVVAAALWALPLVEQLSEEPGNLTIVARFFATSPPGTRTLGQSATMWAAAQTQLLMRGFGQPIGVPLAMDARPWLVAVALGATALLGVMSWCTRARPGLSLPAGFHALLGLVTLAEIHRSPGLVGDYTIFWLAPVGVSGIALGTMWGISGLASRAAGTPVALAVTRGLAWLPTGAFLVALAATVLDLRGHLGSVRGPQEAEAVALFEQTRAGLRARGIASPMVHIADDLWAEAAATLLQMYKAREPFAVDPAWRFMYGRPLTGAGCHTHAARFVVEGTDARGDRIAQAGRADVRVERLGSCP